MAARLSRAAALGLAPDAATARAAADLASPERWARLGRDGALAWGECPGSGEARHRVEVSLDGARLACSCPSRKRPCKHAVALLALAGDDLPETPRPSWPAPRARRSGPAPSPAGREVSRQRRLARVEEGLALLDRWLEDLVEPGLARAPSRGPEFFDAAARRLVDAQAPGAARRVRRLGALVASGEDWVEPFVDELARLALLSRATRRLDTLPPELAAAALAALELPALERGPAVTGRWQVVAAPLST